MLEAVCGSSYPIHLLNFVVGELPISLEVTTSKVCISVDTVTGIVSFFPGEVVPVAVSLPSTSILYDKLLFNI